MRIKVWDAVYKEYRYVKPFKEKDYLYMKERKAYKFSSIKEQYKTICRVFREVKNYGSWAHREISLMNEFFKYGLVLVRVTNVRDLD